ncbi:MAG: cofactor-independent phosphoglycerate mutase [Clostridiales Family XIII bacterium]|jgi:2,3-bisphosphoglycerate-independent phosphoglycerate mutase|nr:cofactor-independent phosphoglycerate mutase [Clostridiales Family XIII bacterium]
MKYLIIVPDGSADRPDVSSGKTPLDEAHMPNFQKLATHGEVGLVKNIPDGIPPASDAANLAVMGYDPEKDLTGRSPLEAGSMGLTMSNTDVSFRTNLVTFATENKESDAYEDRIIIDHSAGDITNEEAAEIIRFLDEKLGFGNPKNGGRARFFPGVSYRHILMIEDGDFPTESGIGNVVAELAGYKLTPPHDILTQRIGDYLPKGEGSEFILDMMRESSRLLQDHPVNRSRAERGLNTADGIWIWGEGTRPSLESFKTKFGIEGSVISAVDLIKGIGVFAGLNPVSVEGATGTLTSNFAGKATAAIREFESGRDFVYIHVEAPDECSHQGNRSEKIKAIEIIDQVVAEPVLKYLEEKGEDYRVLVVPDHRTPLALRTHSDEPVPFVLYDSRDARERKGQTFSESSGGKGTYFSSGKALAEYFFRAPK